MEKNIPEKLPQIQHNKPLFGFIGIVLGLLIMGAFDGRNAIYHRYGMVILLAGFAYGFIMLFMNGWKVTKFRKEFKDREHRQDNLFSERVNNGETIRFPSIIPPNCSACHYRNKDDNCTFYNIKAKRSKCVAESVLLKSPPNRFFSNTYIIMGRPNGEIKSILNGFSFAAAFFGVWWAIVKHPIREAIIKSLKYDFGSVLLLIFANNEIGPPIFQSYEARDIMFLLVSLSFRFQLGSEGDEFIKYYKKRGYKIVDYVKASSNTEAERVYFNKIGQTRPKSKSNESFDKYKKDINSMVEKIIDKSGVKKDDPYLEIERIHSLLEKGIITKEEFELKKKQLLNL